MGVMTSLDSVDLYGEKYVRDFERNQSPERLRRVLGLMELKMDFAVADFACGSGMLMEYVAPYVTEYFGVDFSEPFIKVANQRRSRLNIQNATFVCSGIEEFCQAHPSYFDVAMAMDVAEHIFDDEWVSILENIRSSLKAKGKLYLHTPNAEFLLEIMKSKNFILKQFKEHIAVRTPRHNTDLLRMAGFSKVRAVLLPHYNSMKYLHFLSFLPLMGRYFKARIFMIAEK
jgi:cyclopropane fatty-acyl-phospholipid synthase-like methyltransferase